MPQSMTGFATLSGAFQLWRWSWDIRSVNGRGLDMRLRIPDWVEGLEPQVRAAVKTRVTRGNVTVGLKVSRDEGAAAARLDPAALEATLDRIAQVTGVAGARGMALAQPSAAEVLSMRGLMDSTPDDDIAPLARRLAEDLGPLLDAFLANRAAEGAAIGDMLTGQLDRIAADAQKARALTEARADHVAAALKANLAAVMENAQGADPGRVAQELAMIAVKADVTEELDRLDAHIGAARALLAEDGPVGRKFDFLTQEFNREANTLCSKAAFTDLTRVGLDLKTCIDQMREQVQNME